MDAAGSAELPPPEVLMADALAGDFERSEIRDR